MSAPWTQSRYLVIFLPQLVRVPAHALFHHLLPAVTMDWDHSLLSLCTRLLHLALGLSPFSFSQYVSSRSTKTKRGFQSAFHSSEAIDCFFPINCVLYPERLHHSYLRISVGSSMELLSVRRSGGNWRFQPACAADCAVRHNLCANNAQPSNIHTAPRTSAALVRHNKLFSFSRVVLRSIVALDLALVPFTRISRQYSQSHNLSVSGQTTQGASTATDPIDKATPDRCREIVHRESISSESTKFRNLSNDDDGFQLLTIV